MSGCCGRDVGFRGVVPCVWFFVIIGAGVF